MKNLKDIKSELRDWVAEGIPETVKALKAVLPPNGARYQDLILLEGRLKEVNLSALRGVISNEELQIAYNQIRASLLDLINALEEADLQEPAPGASAEASKVRSGNILYRIPDAMQLNKEHKCLVRIAVNEEMLLENIELDQDIRLQSIRISDVMLVQLLDPSEEAPFHISSVNSAEQFIDEDAFTEWLFYVKPLLAGTYPLLLKVAVLELVNGKERQREIVLEETVQIVTESVPEPDEAPLKTAAYQLNLSGAAEGDALIHAPQPAPAPSAIPRHAPSQKSARRSIVGIVRVLAMVGVFSVIGLVAIQEFSPNLSESNPVFPDKGNLPSAVVSPKEDSIWPDAPPVRDTAHIKTDSTGGLSPRDTVKTTAISKPPLPPRPINPVTDIIRIRGGVFTMGCADVEDPDCFENEYPARQVRMRDFSISATEITAAQYVTFLNAYGATKVKTGAHAGKALFAGAKWLQRDAEGVWSVSKNVEQLPAVNITWYGANEFAKFFEMRLPSEAEWEYAAKGGRANSGFHYAGSDNMNEVGWDNSNAGKRIHAVRMKKPNALGLYDMSGNVWEWTADCKHINYEGAPNDGKAWTTGGDCTLRVLRGGSFANSREVARVTARKDGPTGYSNENIGFRVAKD